MKTITIFVITLLCFVASAIAQYGGVPVQQFQSFTPVSHRHSGSGFIAPQTNLPTTPSTHYNRNFGSSNISGGQGKS